MWMPVKEEATLKRKPILWCDGRRKQILRGDAVAGIVITLINIIGGWLLVFYSRECRLLMPQEIILIDSR
jgi:type III secretory pathway component EscV